MKKLLTPLIGFLLMNYGYSQVGINIESPTAMLDVNGDARIRDIKTLSPTDVIPIYATSEGLIGTALLQKETQITSVPPGSTNMSTVSATAYNNMSNIVVPVINPTNFNTMGTTITSSGSIRINSDGYYQFNPSMTLYVDRNSGTSSDYLWAYFIINIKRANNSNSIQLQSSSDIIPLPYTAGSFLNHNLPSLISEFKTGDEISFAIRRVNNSGGAALGVAVSELRLNPSFTLQKL